MHCACKARKTIMSSKIVTMQSFFFMIYLILSSCISAEFLDCSSADPSISVENEEDIGIKQPFINFKYNRNNLQIYLYPGTPSVNLFFNETETSMQDGWNISNLNYDTNHKNFFNSDVIGVANIKKNLIDAANSIIKNVAEIFQKGNNGIIEIPDIKHRFFTASKGTFEGLSNIQKDPNVQLRASPFNEHPQIFFFAFNILEGHIKYNSSKFRILPFVGNLCFDIHNIQFIAVVQMNFNHKQCQPNLKDFHMTAGTTKVYSCGRLNFITNPIMKWFVNAWDQEILDNVKIQIEFVMPSYIYESFECENFRPRSKM